MSSTTATTISLSWSVPSGSVVDSYEVMWERDTSGECPDEDEGSATITDGSTSYTITGLEEDSSYTITVTATNAVGSAVSHPLTGTTGEAGKGQCHNHSVDGNLIHMYLLFVFSSSVCPSHFCQYI